MDLNRAAVSNSDENYNSKIITHSSHPISYGSRTNFMTNLGPIHEGIYANEEEEEEEMMMNQAKDWILEKEIERDIYERNLSEGSSGSQISSPRAPRFARNLSMMSADSIDEIDEMPLKVGPSRSPDIMASNRDTDVMAASRSLVRSRRSGFAFRFGAQEVPANAFVNTQDGQQSPKMLSVAEMMLKLHTDNRTGDASSSGGRASNDSNLRSLQTTSQYAENQDVLTDGVSTAEKFSLVGLRKMTSFEIEEDLKFLRVDWDQRLDLTLLEKIALLWYEKWGRFAAWIILGMLIALFLRFSCALCYYILGS